MQSQEQQPNADHDAQENPVGNEGPSYSSSYNESTPGEVIENRQEALDHHDQSEAATHENHSDGDHGDEAGH